MAKAIINSGNLLTASATSRWETLWAGFYICCDHQSCSIARGYKEPWYSEEWIYCATRTGEGNMIFWYNYVCLCRLFQSHWVIIIPSHLAILFASLGCLHNLGHVHWKLYYREVIYQIRRKNKALSCGPVDILLLLIEINGLARRHCKWYLGCHLACVQLSLGDSFYPSGFLRREFI